ncbi:MAG: M20/M25/M40 family metallo-hydrolase [Thermoanaerobaculia bacterium]|nr:M20/M25/M40 family metallo-hydrolase [Thermoanaerobaculia bacterium]
MSSPPPPDGPLEPRRRRAARLALYGGLGALMVALWLSALVVERALELGSQWGDTDWAADPAVELLRDYVRIPTVPGREILGAEFLRRRLSEGGVEATLEPLGDGQANLWAILEGESPETLVLHHHIDVTPVPDAENWLHPPFAAEIEGPWLYGRGVFDMKSYAAAQIEAFLAVARSDRPLRRSLMLLATSDEESGSRLGTQWVLAQHPELVRRMWGVLTEGGVVEALNPEQIKYWGVETFQMRLVRTTACSPSRERLEDLRTDLRSWPASDQPVVLTPEAVAFFRDYGPSRSYERTRNSMRDPLSVVLQRWRFDQLPQFARDLLHNAAVPWEIERRSDGSWALPVNLLLVPGAEPQAAFADLLPDWAAHGLTWSIGAPEGSAEGSPLDHTLHLALIESLQRAHPGAAVGSYFLPYNVTDARFFRQQGVPSYGYSPFLFFTTDTIRADRTNERVPLPGFVSGAQIYRSLVESLVLDPG